MRRWRRERSLVSRPANWLMRQFDHQYKHENCQLVAWMRSENKIKKNRNCLLVANFQNIECAKHWNCLGRESIGWLVGWFVGMHLSMCQQILWQVGNDLIWSSATRRIDMRKHVIHYNSQSTIASANKKLSIDSNALVYAWFQSVHKQCAHHDVMQTNIGCVEPVLFTINNKHRIKRIGHMVPQCWKVTKRGHHHAIDS